MIMYIEMCLPPGKRRVVESAVYHLYPYISTVTCYFLISYEPGLIASIKNLYLSKESRCSQPALALDIPVQQTIFLSRKHQKTLD